MRIFCWKDMGCKLELFILRSPALGRKDEEMNNNVTKKQFAIKVNGEDVVVTEDVYRAYYQGHNKEDDFSKSDIRNNVFYYSGLDSDDHLGEDIITDDRTLSVEEQIILSENLTILHKALNMLEENEKKLIVSLYYENMSMREFSRKTGIALSTLQYQHTKILKKLKNFF